MSGVQQEIAYAEGPVPAPVHPAPVQPAPHAPHVVMASAPPAQMGAVALQGPFTSWNQQQINQAAWDVRIKVSSLNTVYLIALCLQLCVFSATAFSYFGIAFWLQLSCVLFVLWATRSRCVVDVSLGLLKVVIWIDNLVNLAYFVLLLYLVIAVLGSDDSDDDDDSRAIYGTGYANAFFIIFLIFAFIVLVPVFVVKVLGLIKVHSLDPLLMTHLAAERRAGRLSAMWGPAPAQGHYVSPYPTTGVQPQYVAPAAPQYAQPTQPHAQPTQQYAQPTQPHAQPAQQYAQAVELAPL